MPEKFFLEVPAPRLLAMVSTNLVVVILLYLKAQQ